MPAWPLGWTYTKGLLGIDQRTTVAGVAEGGRRSIAQPGPSEIETESFTRDSGRSRADGDRARDRPHAVRRQLRGLPRTDAQGRQGLPESDDGVWLWGGEPETIAETIRVGINSAHPDTRVARRCWPSAATGCSRAADVENVVAYVQILVQSRARRRSPRRKRRSRKGGLRRQLRRLPRRGRQGQGRCSARPI